jgi:hypothetical protein
MNPEVCIIILNWNGWNDTIECLESLYQNKYDNYRVILVDNASEDDSLEKIAEYSQGRIEITTKLVKYQRDNKPVDLVQINGDKADKKFNTLRDKLVLIKNRENQGFAIGNNVGMRFALNNFNPDYFLLLNNDTVVDSEFLIELVNTAESDEKIGFIGPKTYLYDDKDVIQAAGGGYIDFSRGESHEVAFMEKDTGEFDRDINLDYVGGSCLLVKRFVTENIGLLDEKFYMYWEDVDWCFNGREVGYKSIYSYKSKIWHKYGTSSQDHFKTYYHNRNRLYFMKKHAPPEYYRKFMAHYLPEILRESVYQLIYKRNWKLFKSLIKGAVDGIRIKNQ